MSEIQDAAQIIRVSFEGAEIILKLGKANLDFVKGGLCCDQKNAGPGEAFWKDFCETALKVRRRPAGVQVPDRRPGNGKKDGR